MSKKKPNKKKNYDLNRGDFSSDDCRLFRLLIDYPLESVEFIAKTIGECDLSSFYYQINKFCKKYRCRSQIQVLNWELLGLNSFFLLTEEVFEHPYVIRQYELLGDTSVYLTQCVAPDLRHIKDYFPEFYQITKTYRPTNDVGLLRNEYQMISFVDEWLLGLKEIMVEKEIGDIIYEQDLLPVKSLNITKTFLENLREIYLHDKIGRFDARLTSQINLIKSLKGFLSIYLDLKIPKMVDYLLILNKIRNPKLFVGGFLGKFPLLELYEIPNGLICRFQIPEPHYSKFSLELFTHMQKLCIPYLWLLLDDKRIFNLQEQYNGTEWIPFKT
ncbi:MAG: hypothetical protein ACTSYB_07500 [Candidatus Helarchaeota archaeon]